MPAKIAVVIATTAGAITSLDTLMGAAGVLGASSPSITDANRTRIIDWINTRFDPSNTLTDAQAAVQMAQEILNVLRQNIINYEREQVRATADSSITDIPLT